MYTLARLSVKYPTTVLMMVLAIILLGYISFQRLHVDLLPDLHSPRLFVEIKAGERPPEEMERQFVTQLEAVISRGRMVENVSSISRVGRAMITVEYSWDADMDEAYLDLQTAIADFSQDSEADEITASQHDPNAAPIIVALFSHPELDDLDKLRQTAENVVRNDLIRLPGIAAVEVIGAQRREVEVKTDAYTLEAYGLTIDQLAAVIENSNRNMSAGSIVEMGRRYVIRGIGELTAAEDLHDLIVAYVLSDTAAAGRSPIYLREVARVEYVLSEPENIVRVNGERCLALEIYKEARVNTIEAATAAREELSALEQALPGYNLQVIQDQSHFVRTAVAEVEETGLVGALLAVLVLYVFLRRIGVTMVISLAIPISVIATFNLMYFNDLTLNIMTLGGLALGCGMLVDNAIVVMENTFRHLELGTPPTEAAVHGAGEVGGAITSSTLTTIVVFLPIVYLHGVAGELFREQAWTVAFSLLSSLFVALAVIPMLSSRLLKNLSAQIPTAAIRIPRYGRFLLAVVQKRKQVALAAGVLVVFTAMMVPLVGSEFVPNADEGELYIHLRLPEGTSLERTAGTVRNLESTINQRFGAAIRQIYSRIGPSETFMGDTEALTDENSAVLQLVLNPDGKAATAEIVAGLNDELSALPEIDARLVVQQTALQSTLGTTSAPLVVEIEGDDLDLLSGLADQVAEKLQAIPELMNTETSFQEGRPEINIEIDRIVAAQFSLTAAGIGSQLNDILTGRGAGQLAYQGEYCDIVLRRPRVSLQELAGTLLESSSGRRVRLDEVARLVPAVSPREVLRNNQNRIARVTADLAGDEPFDKIVRTVQQAVESIALPSGYSFAVTGQEKLRREAFGNLEFALLLAIVLVYMVMAAQFESLLHPFIILLTIPMAGVGAVLSLLVFGIPFNIMSIIGLILLAGIAVNNAIVLVDRINRNRREGQELDLAIVRAGEMRIRPILITSLTTILALVPLTIGIGEGASLRAPMAVAVIGGLCSSTLMTLVVIPAVYRLMAGRVPPDTAASR